MAFESAPVRGVTVHYGARDIDADKKFGGSNGSRGRVKTAVYRFEVDDLPTGSLGALAGKIPAGAEILSSYAVVKTGVVTTGAPTSMEVDLTIGDYTETGLSLAVTANAIAANVSAASTTSGAVGTADAELAVALTFTAGTAPAVVSGEIEVVVEYAV